MLFDMPFSRCALCQLWLRAVQLQIDLLSHAQPNQGLAPFHRCGGGAIAAAAHGPSGGPLRQKFWWFGSCFGVTHTISPYAYTRGEAWQGGDRGRIER